MPVTSFLQARPSARLTPLDPFEPHAFCAARATGTQWVLIATVLALPQTDDLQSHPRLLRT
jgi:hypothetical protein